MKTLLWDYRLSVDDEGTIKDSGRAKPWTYRPSLVTRLSWWFGIYLLSYLYFIWCWTGELSQWESILKVPEGLLFLSVGVFGPPTDSQRFPFACLAYGLYLTHLILLFVFPGKKTFWTLLGIFLLISVLGAIGWEFAGVLWGMSEPAMPK